MATESLTQKPPGECNLLNFLDFQIAEIKLAPLQACADRVKRPSDAWVHKYRIIN